MRKPGASSSTERLDSPERRANKKAPRCSARPMKNGAVMHRQYRTNQQVSPMDYPVTDETIARAKAAADAERKRDGIEVGPDGTLIIRPMVSVRKPCEVVVMPQRSQLGPINRVSYLGCRLDDLLRIGYTTVDIRQALKAIDAAVEGDDY